jgi:hypothetical protein
VYSCGRTNRRALARIATDGAAHGTQGSAIPERSALPRRNCWLPGLLCECNRIDAHVLLRPDLTLTEVRLLVLLTLSLGRIENRLLGQYWPCQQKDDQFGDNARR